MKEEITPTQEAFSRIIDYRGMVTQASCDLEHHLEKFILWFFTKNNLLTKTIFEFGIIAKPDFMFSKKKELALFIISHTHDYFSGSTKIYNKEHLKECLEKIIGLRNILSHCRCDFELTNASSDKVIIRRPINNHGGIEENTEIYDWDDIVEFGERCKAVESYLKLLMETPFPAPTKEQFQKKMNSIADKDRKALEKFNNKMNKKTGK